MYVYEANYPPTVVGGYQRVSEFLPDDEAAAILDRFRWEDTAVLPETEPDGSPAVFYVVIRINDMAEADVLDRASVPWDIRPLFPSERPSLPDEPLVMAASGAHGSFVFALLGGRAINLVRQSALDGDPAFELIDLRTVPSDVAVNDDGSVDLRALASEGFVWPSAPEERTETPDGDVGVSVEPISEILTDIITSFVTAGSDIARAFSEFIGLFFRTVAANAALTVGITISSPDADFAPAGAPLLRTWGPGRGTPIGMVGQQLVASDVGVFATYTTTLGAGNTAALTVPNGRTYIFCLRNALRGGAVLDWVLPTQTCSPPIPIPAGAGAATVAITFADQDLQALAVSVDGVDFLGAQQIPIRTPIIASGNRGQFLARTGNGFAIGLGGRDPASLIAITTLDFAVLGLASTGIAFLGIPAGALPTDPVVLGIRSMMNVDIIWPPGNPSRLVIAHEFGHHAFYQLMINFTPPTAPFSYALHLLEIFLGTVFGGGAPGPGPFFEQLVLNEAIADVFAGQLAGGGNRLPFIPGVYAGDTVGTGGTGVGEMYCNPTVPTPTTPGCFDFNIDGTVPRFGGPLGPLNDEVSRFSTLFFDLLDDAAGDVGHSGQVWTPVTAGCPSGAATCASATSLVAAPGPTAGAGEEAVAVPFRTFVFGVAAWHLNPVEGLVFQENTLMRGMTTSLRLSGTSDAALMTVYGLHTPFVVPPIWFP